jgi:hypothetical protein
MRLLALWATGLESITHSKRMNDSLFRAALDSFLEFPPQPDILMLSVDVKGQNVTIPHPVYHRVTRVPIRGRSLHLIVDARGKKPIESEITNRLLNQDRLPEGISDKDDTFSQNFVIANDNYVEPVTAEERLADAKALREAWVAHVRGCYEPYGYRVWVYVEPGDLGYGNIRGYVAEPEKERGSYIDTLMRGTRPGSFGKLIGREQFRIHIEGNGRHQVKEFDIYPYDDMTSEETPKDLRDSPLWDFRKKIQDDATGRYVGHRIYDRSEKRLTDQSLYELLYPPQRYNWLIARIMQEQIVPRKKRTLWRPFG